MSLKSFNYEKVSIFAYSFYYPRGGWDDFKDSFDSIAERKERVKYFEEEGFCIKTKDPIVDDLDIERHYDAIQVIDTQTGVDVSDQLIELVKLKP